MKNLLNTLSLSIKTLFFTSILAFSVGTYADDTEIFYSVNVEKPNLLFVLDMSSSMGTAIHSTTDTTSGTGPISAGIDDAVQEGSTGAIDSSSSVITIDHDNGLTTSARFRFKNIDIPQGATIRSASLQFTAASDDNDPAAIKIYTEAVDDAEVNPSTLFGSEYYGSYNWSITKPWVTGDRSNNQRAYVRSLVSSVINRPGWESGNSIAFHLESSSNKRSMFAFEDSSELAAELYIQFGGQDRLQALQESLRVVLEQAPDNVKIGLMNYGTQPVYSSSTNHTEPYRHHSVSGVTFPVTDINAKAREVIATENDVHGLPGFPSETVTVREFIADIADSWEYKSLTPIVDALYEAALYFRGEKMHYGQSLPTLGGAHPSTYDGPVVTSDVIDETGPGRVLSTSPKYISPIQSSCQANYIVLMSDGSPSYTYNDSTIDGGPLARLKGTADGPQGALADAIGSCDDPVGVNKDGTCGAELTHYLAENDNLPDPTSSFPNGQYGDQFIKTFTIGLGVYNSTRTYLKSLATYDDGIDETDDDGYFDATNPEELAAAFADIIDEVVEPKGTLASPGYSVNVKNGLEHEKDIYIPVFDRKNSSRWSGNLKKFKIADANGKRLIKGKNDVVATDELGNFTDNALDYWSTSSAALPDGKDISKGGVANLLDPDTRNIFSNLSGTTDVTLNSASNSIDLSNINSLTNAVLGLPDSSTLDYRKRVVSFMRGWENGETDSSATPPPAKRFHMGDMLHSEPLVMTYNQGSGAALTGKKQYIFAGTNEGYLHAFDAETGEEKFAFIPADLLRTISESQFLNAGTQKDHKYGIDGAITGDFIGGDDGVLDPGDQVIIYFGMRRGGSAYYALDVTDINNPKLLWKKSAADHASMGQSWSRPYVATVADSNGNPKEVVMVSGGYDEDEDRDTQTFCANENNICTLPDNVVATVMYGANNTWVSKSNVTGSINCNNATFGDPLVGTFKSCKYELNQNDYDSTTQVTADVGNDLFIFDAKTGEKVWSMTTEMRSMITSSIAGGIRPLDTNNNNLIDRVYFGDTGGNVWRLDLSENDGTTTKLKKLASLGGTGSNNRMFFNEPDVALMRLNGRSVYAVSIGSGFRAHPMDQAITDKFYVLLDESPFAPLETEGGTPYSVITEATLGSITISSSGGITQSGSITDGTKRGWLINLPENGEKVLGEATAVNGSIIFPTLVPEAPDSVDGIDQCAAPVTYSRLYAIDILTGTAKWDLNDDDETPEPFTKSLTAEIISSVNKVFNTPEPNKEILGTDGNPTGKTECNHTVDLRVGKKASQVSGYNACRLESVYWSDPAESKN